MPGHGTLNFLYNDLKSEEFLMGGSDEKKLNKKIKIDLEKGENVSEIASKYEVSEKRVKIIKKKKPPICKDKDFLKFEKIREYGCLDEFGSGKITPTDLKSIFCDASKLIVREMSKKRYEHLISPIEPREWELRHAICDTLSKNKFNYIIECPIKDPFEDSKKNNNRNRDKVRRTDIAILTENGIIDIELKNAHNEEGLMTDFRKFLSSPYSTIGTASFYISTHADIDSRLLEIEKKFNLAYKKERKKLKNGGIVIHKKWYLFFLLAFYENRTFSCTYENINNMNFEINNELEFSCIN